MSRENVTSLALCVGIILLFILGCADPGRRGSGSTDQANAGPQLRLLSHHGTRERRYMIIEGEVQNITSQPIDNIQATVECRDASGTFVTSDDSMIEYLPLMPGQTSPFKVMIRDNPIISTYNVGFKRLFGGAIATDFPTPTPIPTGDGRTTANKGRRGGKPKAED